MKKNTKSQQPSTRREFMQKSALAGAGLLLMPSGSLFGAGAASNRLNIALRDGDWKLIRFSNRNAKSKVNYALYHLSEDIGEQHNILTQHPERADAMTAVLDSIYAGRPASQVLTNH